MDNVDERLPNPPKLNGDTLLDVFTHSSLRDPTDPRGNNNERLAVLGQKVTETAVVHALLKKEPVLSANEIRTQTDSILSDDNIERWITAYGFRDKVACDPAVLTLNTPEDNRLLFSSYVGAVYQQNGIDTVQNWIGILADPGFVHTPSSVAPHTRSTQPTSLTGAAHAASSSIFLSLFNQTASQKRVPVDYSAQFVGPSHAGSWTVQCIVGGTLKGRGSGTSKQLAKEEAAKEAYFAMGWAPHTLSP